MNLSLENQSRSGAESRSYFESYRHPIDMEHLSTYTMGNKNLEKEVLQLFRRQSSIYFEKLREAQSMESWSSALRVLKASARSVGAWRLEMLTAAAEQYAFRKRSADRLQHLTALSEQIALANGYIDMQLQA